LLAATLNHNREGGIKKPGLGAIYRETSRNENVKSDAYRTEREELKTKQKTDREPDRDTEKEKTAMGYKTEREELKNPGRQPDRDRWQKK